MKNFLIVILFAGLAACKSKPAANQVVFGKVWTGNEKSAWAEGFAVIGDSIVAVGSRNEIETWTGPQTKVIETDKGNLIVPGFIDCHTHFMEGGFALASVQLRDAKTKEEFINRIKAFALTQPKGAWITSGDWDHENWGGELPTRDWIDSVTRDNPVWINRLDGHMNLANTATLKLAGVDDNAKEVTGGAIVRDKKGRITGVFKDNATSLIDPVVPDPSDEQKDMALHAAMNYVASFGVTSIHNMDGYMDVFERARKSDALITRIYAGMSLRKWRELNEKIQQQGRGDKWLRIGSLKAFVDGSLGSHTAAFFKPFEDTPTDSGFFVVTEAELYKRIKSADSAGLHVMTHAIGDKAVNTLLNIYERVIKENGERDRRFRMEHSQHPKQEDFRRFAELQVIPSMQPYHAIDDGRWAEKFIGERIKTTYAFRSFLNAQANLVFGSDWFVAPPIPLEGIYAAVTRQTIDGKNPDGWVPEQKISVEEALKSYTIRAAYASFEEDIKGSIATGKLADFVILERDITQIDPVGIREVKVLKTVVGGKTVYERQ
ncbi:MAG TPA: amidohydrolase [Cyclobacteriaceae bacterium]|jgi:predicted amidohydrolase YtcJ|nr:amidohydrolase [Cyclobacteriaceae bacterium]HRF34577.1 amidohydrolase [Cyclobacteriaceae bacterium]